MQFAKSIKATFSQEIQSKTNYLKKSSKGAPSSSKQCRTVQSVLISSPFDEQFFADLIIWEESFYSHKLSQAGIEKMIQAYGRLVEYFDQKMVPLKRYFLDKLQFTLSRPKIINQMIYMNGDSPTRRDQQETRKNSFTESEISKLSEMPIQDLDVKVQKTRAQAAQEFKNERSPSYQGRVLERAFNVKQQLLVKDQSEKNNLGQLLESCHNLSEKIENFKQKEISRQNDIIQEKIQARFKQIEQADKNSPSKLQVRSQQRLQNFTKYTIPFQVENNIACSGES